MQQKTISNIISRDGNNLDLIRLIAALAVIFYHSFALNPQWGIKDPIHNYFGYVTTGGLAVKVFFFISGLLVTNSILTRKSIVHFVFSRTFRIFPGLLFVLVSTSLIIGPLATTLSIDKYFSDSQVYSYIMKNIILDTQYFLPGVFQNSKYGVNGSLWTIHYEVLAYTFLLIFFFIGACKLKPIASAACIIIILEPLTPFKGVFFASSDNSAIYLLAPCFALGSLLAINKEIYTSNLYTPLIIIVATLFSQDEAVKSFLFSISTCLVALHISTIGIIKKIKPHADISYGVYLWGFPVQQAYSQSLHLGIIENIALSIITTIIIAWASWVYVERPSIELSKKLIGRISTSSVFKRTHE
ncbi:acyltransferase family protein [Serratia marcescens]|uniref:acyltransferase family protein n=1 Tax=Serratia marcescens TaxID=615 RepID=UPI0009419961|nr:acyltransferase [Serratia marcescens]